VIDHGSLWARAQAIGGGLWAMGVRPGDRVALLCGLHPDAVVTFVGALAIGACAVPLPPGVDSTSLVSMVRDSGARVLFVGSSMRSQVDSMHGVRDHLREGGLVATDFVASGFAQMSDLAAKSPALPAIDPDGPFNIIYSSGTTGAPRGIVHSHRMRAFQVARMQRLGIGPDSRVLLATPLHSNTTLVALLPTLALGGTALLLPKFDPQRLLELSERERVTHTMLVPVQYRRVLDEPDFDAFDLHRYQAKLVTGALMGASLKQELLDRFPGRLLEIYGVTEGGCTTVLDAGAHPDKLATVGRPAQGVEVVILDEEGRELPPGEVGEIAGRAVSMMSGYHGREDLTEAITWRDGRGRAFYRTGDLGRLDEDGFLCLCGRKKDVIISGGLNLYPAEIESVLLGLDGVADAAVVAVPSERFGETPVAFVVLHGEGSLTAEEIKERANAQLGRVQRVSEVVLSDDLPRNALGKVRKDELRRRV
jgi:acyl-CoA synthetase (AMP-forming)/AMP-acid ligase II